MGKLYVTITIDTENSQGAIISGKWTKDTMLGFCRGKNWGIRYILKMLAYYNVQATWYLSIFEECIFGKKLMAEICDLLKKHNQDIQLHTHPVWLMDNEERKRVHMHQYALDEQIYIIDKGIKDIYELTGERPIAHRAGGYGVNRDTFKAMKECGIKIDSSIFYKERDCKVQTSGIKNKVADFMGITEMPVSIYKKHINHLCKMENFSSTSKIDINWTNADEIINIFKDGMKNGCGYLNLFMHSGSFYGFYRGQGLNSIEDVANRNDDAARKFHKVMRYIMKTPEIEVVTVPKLYGKYIENELPKIDYVPELRILKIR